MMNVYIINQNVWKKPSKNSSHKLGHYKPFNLLKTIFIWCEYSKWKKYGKNLSYLDYLLERFNYYHVRISTW